MSGFVGDLSPKQAEVLAQLKVNIADIMKPQFDDHYLLRWCRARKFDLKKSEKMLRDSMIWRKKFGADDLLKWDAPEVLKKYYPGGYFGHDKEGCPMWIDTLGTVDLKGFFYSVRKNDVIRWKIYGAELAQQRHFPENSKKFGKRIDQTNIIFDMEGISMKHLWKPAIDTFTEILTVFEANYPETLKISYVVNAPAYFTVIYNIVRPFLSEDTRSKMRILGPPAIFPIAYNLAKPFLSEDTKTKIRILGKNWKEHLLKDTDPDQLPVNWGGTCTDPDGDPYCRSKVCMGGDIPKSYYMPKLDENVDLSQFTAVTVARGSSLQIDTEVKEEGCILRWQFWTEGMDIGFGVFLRTADKKQKKDEMEEVVISSRVNSHIIPEDGSLTCEKTGTYILRWDNTYSWVNQKKVSYLIEVLPPDHSDELQITAL